MADMEKLNLDELDNAVGGRTVIIQNDATTYANIRKQPGLGSEVILEVDNGNKLETTGNKVKKDGYVWYEVKLPRKSGTGWIAGSLIGY